MKINLSHNGESFSADLSKPIDISIPLVNGVPQLNCFYAPVFSATPVRAGDFVGSTQEGGAVNFFNVRLNIHGNGTHTECVGHISEEWYNVHSCVRARFHFIARLHTVYPKYVGDDLIILPDQLTHLDTTNIEALVLRTMPNDFSKCYRNYSGTNPPYLHHEAAAWCAEKGIEHLLLDIPSVDREDDQGMLLAHKAFWQYPEATRLNASITELIYVPNEARDGLYLLNLQFASFMMDASPAKPVLYALTPVPKA